MFKRLTDIALSALALIALAPLLAAVALWIKLDSRGPVFYRGVRIGHLGSRFRIFKFRTMVVNADQIGGPSTPADDRRITRAGRFLRKYKLDELPQFINVLKGEMSFVGPRPEVPQYVDMFNEEEQAILTVRPGITDWATLWNFDEGTALAGNPDPEKTFLEKVRPEKVRLQLEYVRRRSFWVDVKIIVQTVAAIVFRVRPPALDVVSRKGSSQYGI